MHAATDATLPNPFLQTDNNQSQPPQHPGDLQFGGGSVIGGGVPGTHPTVHSSTKPGPPQRPPPPHPKTATPSPAHSVGSSVASKSAFDDLNDSIRMALGNSPAKQPMGGGVVGGVSGGGGGVAVGPSVAGAQPALMYQPQMTGFNAPQQQPMYSSPAKQPIGLYGFLDVFFYYYTPNSLYIFCVKVCVYLFCFLFLFCVLGYAFV